MGIFDDNPFLSTKPGVQAPAAEVEPATWAQGGYWSVRRRGAGFVLNYLSGELQGRERSVALSDAEAEAIRAGGDAAVDDILRNHGVG